MKVSVSKIEYFRLFIDKCEQERLFGSDEFISGEDMINNIKGLSKRSKHGELGIAFHEIIQDPHRALGEYCRHRGAKDADFGFLASNGIVFPYKSIVDCYGNIDYKYPFEVPDSKEYQVDGEIITVTCRVDQLKLRSVLDLKAIFRPFDFEKFYNSYQWRFYLDILGADFFWYDVFQFNDNTLELNDNVEPFYFLPYANMASDIYELIDEFLFFIHKNKLEQFIGGAK